MRYALHVADNAASTYDFNVETGEKTLLKREPVLGGFDPAHYATEHLWIAARDGTQVPVSIVYRKGFKKDGTAPLLQYGYGSYGLSPRSGIFDFAAVAARSGLRLCDRAHPRRHEMGRSWSCENGLLTKKLNTLPISSTSRAVCRAKACRLATALFAMGAQRRRSARWGRSSTCAPQEYRGIIALVPFVDVVTTML